MALGRPISPLTLFPSKRQQLSDWTRRPKNGAGAGFAGSHRAAQCARATATPRFGQSAQLATVSEQIQETGLRRVQQRDLPQQFSSEYRPARVTNHFRVPQCGGG